MQKRPMSAMGEVTRNATHHQKGVRSSTMPEMRSVTQLSLLSFRMSGTRSTFGPGGGSIVAADILSFGFFLLRGVERRHLVRARHLHVRVPDLRAVGDARVDVEIIQKGVAARVLPEARDLAAGIRQDVAEDDGLRRARLLAGDLEDVRGDAHFVGIPRLDPL